MSIVRTAYGLNYNSSFYAWDAQTVLVLGANGNLWVEHAVNGQFGQMPPPRELVDQNVQAFQILDGNNVLVLGMDGNLWLEHPINGKFGGKVPPDREQIDGNVLAFQAIDAQNVYVLGADGKLWLEHAVNGKFGQQPPPREQVDGPPGFKIAAFQALDVNTVYVLDTENTVYLDRSVNGKFGQLPPPRETVTSAVTSFQALDTNTVYTLDTSNNLWLQLRNTSGPNPWPQDGVQLDVNVAAFRGMTTMAAGGYGAYILYKTQFVTQSASIPGSLVRVTYTYANGKATRGSYVNVDNSVLDFQVIEPQLVILGKDGNLWITTGAFGETVPPPRKQIDGNVASPLAYGTIRPSYQILGLIYAPPGTNGGKNASSVDYSTANTTGSTTSTSSAFKAGLDVKLTIGNSVSGSVSGDFSFSKTMTDSSSVEVDNTTKSEIKATGPAADGIDHDYDLIYLWLNPQIGVAADPVGNVTETLDVAGGGTMLVQYVQVGWLKNPATMPSGVAALLEKSGLGYRDYQAILNVDPFANGGTSIDGNRFQPLGQTFPYEPPDNSSDSPPTTTVTLTNTTTNTQTQQQQVEYGASLSASTPGSALAGLQTTATFNWTSTNAQSQKQGTEQSASVTIGGPAYGYTGPTSVSVYWDTMYRSFMFAFTSVTSGAVKPMPPKAPIAVRTK